MHGLSEGFQVEGWVRGVGSLGPALSGGMLLSQVSLWSGGHCHPGAQMDL